VSTKISKILAKDIVSGKSKFIKDGYLAFDKIVIEPNVAGESIIHFYLQEVFLVSIKVIVGLGTGSTFTFELSNGIMAMRYDDESLCKEPDFGSGERIKAAIEEIREALDE
jgi:hypothetical protein